MTAPFPLTRPQQEILRWIAGYQLAHDGVSPTLREIATALRLPKSGVHRRLGQLVERGWLHRLPNRPRALELLSPVSIPLAPDGAPLFAVPLLQEICHADA